MTGRDPESVPKGFTPTSAETLSAIARARRGSPESPHWEEAPRVLGRWFVCKRDDYWLAKIRISEDFPMCGGKFHSLKAAHAFIRRVNGGHRTSYVCHCQCYNCWSGVHCSRWQCIGDPANSTLSAIARTLRGSPESPPAFGYRGY